MRRKGFTLIELLAVIIILAIIALIATPIVIRVIENSKKNAVKRSVENYIKELKTVIVAERVNENPIPDGIYELDSNGDLCLNEDCTEKLEISMNGKKPNSGSVGIYDSNIISYGTSIIIDEYEFKIGEDNNIIMKYCNVICRPVATSELGNVPTGEYKYGDEYICNVNENKSYHFYVIENGENTNLTSENGRLAGPGEVALLMDSNLDIGIVKWANRYTELYNATNDWIYLSSDNITLPTTNLTQVTGWRLPAWGCKDVSTGGGYLIEDQIPKVIYYSGTYGCVPGNSNNSKIRPAIIVKKTRFE